MGFWPDLHVFCMFPEEWVTGPIRKQLVTFTSEQARMVVALYVSLNPIGDLIITSTCLCDTV